MTISTTSNTVTYTGNGATTNFAYAFLIPEETDLVITLVDLSDDSSSEITTNFSVSGIGDPAGGIVTYPSVGSAITSGFTITIQRELPLVQETDLVNQGPYAPDVVENALDYITMITQQQQEQIDRALAFPVGTDVDTADLIEDILNAAANATSAAASAAAAAASVDEIEALLPLQAANIDTNAVTSAKINANAVTPIKLDTASIPYGATILNGTLVASVAANALTVALKTKAGTDPSATDPVYVFTRSATAENGDYSVLTITSALSLTISSGSTMGFASGVPGRLWAVIFNDTGTPRIGLINCLVALSATAADIYPLKGWGIASSTAEGGAGAADSAGVIYTGAAASNKGYATVGYLTWESGLVTAGAWAAGPTRVSMLQRDTSLPGETVQQVSVVSGAVATGTTVMPYDDTIPQITEGVALLSKAIVPTSAANMINVAAQAYMAHSAGSGMGLAAFKGAAADAIAAVPVRAPNTGQSTQFVLNVDVLAGSSSSITFSTRGGAGAAGTTTFNGEGGARLFGGVITSFLKLREIMV